MFPVFSRCVLTSKLYSVVLVLIGVTVHDVVWMLHSRMQRCLCPKCVAAVMPFHDCSVLSSSSSDMSDVVSQYESIVLPRLTSSASLRIAYLNCHSLLSVADEVFDLFNHSNIDILCCY